MPEWEGGIAPSPDSPESSFVAGATAACRGGMKIPSSLEWGLLVAATVPNGILAGGSLIKCVVELPARRIIGQPAMAAFHRAADLQTGFLIYPALGLGSCRDDCTRDHLRTRSRSFDNCCFGCLLRRSALGGPRFRDDPCGPEPAHTPIRDTRRDGPRPGLPGVYAVADGAGDPAGRDVLGRRPGIGFPPPRRPMNKPGQQRQSRNKRTEMDVPEETTGWCRGPVLALNGPLCTAVMMNHSPRRLRSSMARIGQQV